MKDWKKTLVKPSASIREVIQVLNSTAMQIVLVVNDRNELLGTITDGDIRRNILKGIDLNATSEQVMNRNPKTTDHSSTREKNLQKMTEYRLRHLPILDDNNTVVDIEYFEDLLNPHRKNNIVVLMAGGKGTRMSPLTDDCPKPMLMVAGKPMLEIIIENFMKSGFHNFYVSINYKGEMIEDYFGNGAKWGIDIKYLREKNQLGTAGALSLLNEKPKEPFFVMNGDILTKLDLQQMLNFHEEQESVLTMAIREYDFQVPYGVVKVDGHHIVAIDEKPLHRFFVNAGIYILDPIALEMIPRGEAFDMPYLAEKLIKKGYEPVAFPLQEYWADVGRKADFDRVNGDFVFEGNQKNNPELTSD